MFSYLFKALLKNGQLIEQNQQDQSLITPGKNCFYDVLQNDKDGQLKAFALYKVEPTILFNDKGEEISRINNEYIINLETLEFETNQGIFYLHDEDETGALSNFRLIYFYRRELSLNVMNTSIVGNQIKSYTFGFQCNNKKGENLKYTMTLK